MPGNAFILALLLLTAATSRVGGFSSTSIFYRQGQKSDELKIATALAKELMNPLGVKIERFVVATDTSNNVIGWAQIKPLGELTSSRRDPSKFGSGRGSLDLDQNEQLWELSSVYVESSFRGQGIGSELVKRILRNRIVEDGYLPTSIYLLTLATTVDWYRDNFAFESVSSSDIPGPMAFEVTTGNFITKLIGAQLCCMQGTQQTLDICKSVPAS
ncbi:Acetyltransferase (GNAT) family [Seminavis robusta]|uniref:Acetyltransferase (GNAT) family n=1 Tax=Seminavis robusta TaxID=568900 RepID=A0A9N8F4P2_9STRA|nr:Acetyltransferase (GNAT) family [Seminavis robusta]|eukprot:Sro4076_g352760.1 Acetyltransferase (GNAT) family (215) ;mRNA; r:1859-2503